MSYTSGPLDGRAPSAIPPLEFPAAFVLRAKAKTRGIPKKVDIDALSRKLQKLSPSGATEAVANGPGQLRSKDSTAPPGQLRSKDSSGPLRRPLQRRAPPSSSDSRSSTSRSETMSSLHRRRLGRATRRSSSRDSRRRFRRSSAPAPGRSSIGGQARGRSPPPAQAHSATKPTAPITPQAREWDYKVAILPGATDGRRYAVLTHTPPSESVWLWPRAHEPEVPALNVTWFGRHLWLGHLLAHEQIAQDVCAGIDLLRSRGCEDRLGDRRSASRSSDNGALARERRHEATEVSAGAETPRHSARTPLSSDRASSDAVEDPPPPLVVAAPSSACDGSDAWAADPSVCSDFGSAGSDSSSGSTIWPMSEDPLSDGSGSSDSERTLA